MWDDAKQMNALAITLATLTLACLVVGGGGLRRAPARVRVRRGRRRPRRSIAPTRAQLEAVIRDELAGTFFTMDLARARATLAQRALGARRRAAPAVAGPARGRRRGARAARALERRRARQHARRGVRRRDARRAAALRGPGRRARPRWPSAIARVRGAAAARARRSSDVRLSARGGWQLKAQRRPDGPLTLELGRDEPDARLARFVAAHRPHARRARALPARSVDTSTCAIATALRRAVPGVPREERQSPAA